MEEPTPNMQEQHMQEQRPNRAASVSTVKTYAGLMGRPLGLVISTIATTGFLLFGALKATIGLRASREEETSGLDIPEHGEETYPADTSETLTA